jgi:hypothetical protein
MRLVVQSDMQVKRPTPKSVEDTKSQGTPEKSTEVKISPTGAFRRILLRLGLIKSNPNSPKRPFSSRRGRVAIERVPAKLPASQIEACKPIKKHSNVKERLLAAEGGYYLSKEVAELLDVTQQQITELHQANKIIGLPVQDGRYVYPKWQFAQQEKSHYQPLQGLDEVLAKFPETDPWMQAAFMLNSSGCSEIGTPLSGLQAGKVAEVLLLAQRFGEHGAA